MRESKRIEPLQLGVWILSLTILGYGIYQVIALTWVCDDAFISFRYAKNLVNGLGLVYNAGEHVEGYTNFLWTMIIAAGMWLKLDPLGLSTTLGGLAYFGTVGLMAWWSYCTFRDHKSSKTIFLPIAALALLLHHDSHMWATSGMESSLVTLLITAGFFLLLRSKTPVAFLVSGLILVLAGLTRPDAMLFVAMGICYIILTARPWPKPLLHYVIPLVVLYVPYWFIRYNYYGWPFPNTYYAKSADIPYYSQGFEYFKLYFESYYVLLFAPVLVITSIVLHRRNYFRFPITDYCARLIVLSLLFRIPYLLYVVRSGGDFMFARFFIPITPIMLIVIESSIRSLIPRTRFLVPAALLVLALMLLRWNPFSTDRVVGYIANEPAFYPATTLERAQDIGGKMKTYFRGHDVHLAIRGQFAMYAYYSEASQVIECGGGLTDEYVAHLPLTKRGRPGHEKVAPYEYLFKRKVNFLLPGKDPLSTFVDSLTCIRFGDRNALILAFDNDLMDHLKQFPEIQFMDVRQTIDALIVKLGDEHDLKVLDSYPFLKAYYFDNNHDPEREKWFLNPPKL